MTKLAPRKFVGQMMGVWFMAAALGNLIAGLVGGHVDPEKLDQMPALFQRTAFSLFIAAAVLGAADHPDPPMMSEIDATDSALWRATRSSMALEEYRSKRDFTKSPEPAGDERRTARERKGKPRFFCVQKHLASHLHYDFRLEHDGVLLSWAVPKGPSLDPEDEAARDARRGSPDRVRHVRGRDPEGYGAGIVMLWDQGTWTPESRRHRRGAEEGRPEVHARRLQAQGLVGAGADPRLGLERGKDDGRSWLLIKHKDDWAGDSTSPSSRRSA